MTDKDSQLIWEAYGSADRVSTGHAPSGSSDFTGFSRIFKEKINTIILSKQMWSAPEEKLSALERVRDEAINIVSNLTSLLQNISVDDVLELICSDVTEKLPDLKNDAMKSKTWDMLGRMDPSRTAEIDIVTLLMNGLGVDLRIKKTQNCKDWQFVLKIPIVGKFATALAKRFILNAMGKVLQPFIQDLKTLNTEEDYYQIDTILMQYTSATKRFLRYWTDIFEKLDRKINDEGGDVMDTISTPERLPSGL
jgi:hypothetical protein